MEWLAVLAITLGPILADQARIDQARPVEWLTLLAIIAGPIVAIQVQKMIERVTKEKKEKKDIFLTLMRTRNTLSREHVEALNMIPLLFWKKNPQETEIRTKWGALLTHRLSEFPSDKNEDSQTVFIQERTNRLRELVKSLAKARNYKGDEDYFDKMFPREGRKEAKFFLRLHRSALKIETNPEEPNSNISTSSEEQRK